MNKTQLIDAIAKEADLTKVDSRKALDAFMTVVGKTLGKGENVTLVGFGSFSVTHRPSRMGRNPRTGEPLKIKARNAVRFRPGSRLNKKVNKKK